MATARYYHTATLLPNGKVLVAGGIEQLAATLATAELYDPATGTWSATGSMASRSRFHTATLLPNGKVLVAGRIQHHSGYLATAELYDPATGTWSATGSPWPRLASSTRRRCCPTARCSSRGATAPSGSSREGGGVRPGHGHLEHDRSMASPRHSHTATLLPNGKVLAAGGNYPDSPVTAEVYTR